MSFETISVIGLGYIGLPTAAMFAACKKTVFGVDVNQETVDIVNRGEIHIAEPELDIIVRASVSEGYLKATTIPLAADAFIIAVPTPFRLGSEGSIPEPDLGYIEMAAKAIAPVLKRGDLIVLESTCPVGATEKMAGWLAEKRSDLSFPLEADCHADVNIAHCPERVLPGHVIRELVENDRIIGGLSKRCSQRAIQLYKTFVTGECISTNARTAELAKLTENSCRDVQIAFANELSVICDSLEVDVWELISLANRHPRIKILQPGPGVGGHCIAVDPWFIVSSVPNQAELIHTARKVNDAKPKWVVEKVKVAIADYLLANPSELVENITIVCYGLSFKADIDDLRESPAKEIVRALAKVHRGRVVAVEPNISELAAREEFELKTLEESEGMADIALLLVDHREFVSMMKPNCDFIIDTRGIWS